MTPNPGETMSIRIFDDAEAVSRAAADEFVRCCREALAARGRFAVALSGGSTPRRLYQLLAGPPWDDRIDWGRLEVFWGDERCVRPDHPDSNYRMTREALLTRVPVPPAHVHRIEAERPDHDAAARDYQAALARVLGVDAGGEPPSLDLVLLGMGPDGHTASLFPHTAALRETTRWVAANFVPKFNADRITFTYPTINRAREVLFLVCGADKADVLRDVREGPADPQRLPSQGVRPAGVLHWYLDRAAAARLTQAARTDQ
jgi:6-phosphogluconolactonase